ncbi:uncharacterized protein PITG_07068 [Phytophthora infestans T30-4]|uniref:AB hydrolase-1 domain-containing protein n=1 Tax=Phytophthora infestans (strain T30-4) TaxID=403677 RepID=D0N767_PHYIT|nr:uncharacterized protein PITG_07068 [Phytophthora infestans T30-4]EEY53416.1 conserved hypothetical protein [Phytophthora infestans T30-4]|eukprot:XP_002905034.1 conserved hypothetical protein [Phytophthora infestans T30-4]
MSTKVTLLFAHGGGFCKETWDPIIRRLKESQVVQSVPTEIVTFDFPYHGDKHDSAAVQSFEHDLVGWVAGAVQEQVANWKDKTKMEDAEGTKQHKLIGIGHSMGSAGLWATEVAHPGTFDGLILFEPVLAQNSPETDYMIDFMVGLTLQRGKTWPSRATAEEHFHKLRNFAKWDRETLAGYLQGGLVEADDGTVTLACHPNIEASLYCQPPLWLTEHELQQPKCPITFHWGSRSKMWFRERFEGLQSKLPHIYTMREAMEGNSHVLVLEDPELAAKKIAQDLVELEPYTATSKNSLLKCHQSNSNLNFYADM